MARQDEWQKKHLKTITIKLNMDQYEALTKLAEAKASTVYAAAKEAILAAITNK